MELTHVVKDTGQMTYVSYCFSFPSSPYKFILFKKLKNFFDCAGFLLLPRLFLVVASGSCFLVVHSLSVVVTSPVVDMGSRCVDFSSCRTCVQSLRLLVSRARAQ